MGSRLKISRAMFRHLRRKRMSMMRMTKTAIKKFAICDLRFAIWVSNPRSECGATLLAVMAVMTLFAIALLAVAPAVQQEVQREKELESIRRGEEIADAIRQYVIYHKGAKLPESIDDLLEGLPQGTKKRQILRPSAATDPLSEDGKWRLIKPDPDTIAAFAKRVQSFNNGLLPTNPEPRTVFDRYSVQLLVNINTDTEDETDDSDDDTFDVVTDNQPFIGVASQSRSKSVIAYYGIERHSKWIFTPLFRGMGTNTFNPGSNTSNTQIQPPG
jgi:type II secretory pathway pseudopilin PulG